MKDSKALLLDYLASVRDPERGASLFADDGVFELPFLRSLGVEPRYTGRREITALVHKLLEIYSTSGGARTILLESAHRALPVLQADVAIVDARLRAYAAGREADPPSRQGAWASRRRTSSER